MREHSIYVARSCGSHDNRRGGFVVRGKTTHAATVRCARRSEVRSLQLVALFLGDHRLSINGCHQLSDPSTVLRLSAV